MIARASSRALFLSVCTAAVFAACGPQAQPVVSSDEEASRDDQALPVDQGSHGDTQALPVDQGATQTSAGGGACASDADCVPAQCCHATTCTLRATAPDCSAAMCTRECRGGTLDCGGGCYCNQGQCAARIADPVGLGAAGS